MNLHKLKTIIAQKAGIEADIVEADTTFSSLSLDPLDVVEIVMDIEDEYDIAITADGALQTVGELAECLPAT